MGCSSLKNIQLPDGLEDIGLRAFRESELESVVLPQSVRIVHQSAFCKCPNLKAVLLNEGLEVLGTDEYMDNGGLWCGVFETSTIESVQLPSTLKRIEYRAFWGCTNIKIIQFPEGLEFIGTYCFYQSSLKSIEFPASLRTIA